jgi:hypothetical protein
MLRSSVLLLAVAIVLSIGCGSVSDEGLFGPPDPSLWSGGPSSGGAVGSGGSGGTGGLDASGGTAAGGIAATGGNSAGGVSTGGTSQNGGAGGMDPSTGGSSTEIGSPGVISCGGLPCRSDTQPSKLCCMGGLRHACEPDYAVCPLALSHSFFCDDAADCGGGALCCATATDGLIRAECVPGGCPSQESTVQLCRTNTECPEGLECAPWNKLPEFSTCQ